MANAVTRRDFMKLGAGGLATLALTTPAHLARAAEAKKPNILIVTTDQHQGRILDILGDKYCKTPNIDSIAASGVYFKKSYTPYPLCSPARTSLHTSRTPHEARVDRNTLPIPADVPVSGQIFGAAGYETAYSGKWHMPHPYPTEGIPGFVSLNKGTREGKLAKDVDDATASQAVEFLKRKHDKPFLLVASFINPHDICLPAGESSPLLEALWKRYSPPAGAELPPLPANHEPVADEPEPVAQKRSKKAGVKSQFAGGWDEPKWRRYLYAYHRMVEDVDQAIGRVLTALREAGLEENTLIIFTSDHGDGLAAHNWTGKMNFYEEEAAVPLIVSWKGVTPAARIDNEHLVTALDVLPTILDYAGVPTTAVMRGESLRPVIEKPALPGHEFVVSEMAGQGPAGPQREFMVRTARYKYIVFPGFQHAELFFDMERDPGEMKNLAHEDALAGEVERHRKLLKQWQETTELAKYPLGAAPGGEGQGAGAGKARRGGAAGKGKKAGKGGKKRNAAGQV